LSEELTKKVKRAIAALTVREPFIGVMLKRTWILYDPDLTWAPASTDGLRIRLGPSALQLDERKIAALLAHEVVHAALKHPARLRLLQRKYGLPRQLLNVLADAVVNKYVLETDAGKYLEELNPVLPRHIEEHFGIKGVEKKSLEELVREVAERLPKVKIEVISAKATFGEDVGRPEAPAPQAGKPAGGKKEGKEREGSKGGRGGGREEGEKAGGGESEEKSGEGEEREGAAKREGERAEGGGEEEGAAPAKGRGGGAGFGEGESGEEEGDREAVVINEGDPGEHPGNKLTEEEIERRIERKVASAVETAKRMKGAGTQPGLYERLLKEVLKPKVDWRRVLRERLRGFFGEDYIPTWTRVNKKLPWIFPGKVYLERGDAICLVDTSGSIGERELHQFISEVFAIARAARRRVVVIPWDAAAYPPIEIRGNEDIKRIRVSGYGGTVILPALEAAEKLLRPTTKVVILSDWDIFDINSPKVQAWLKRHRGRILAVTTLRQPPSYLQSIRIEL